MSGKPMDLRAFVRSIVREHQQWCADIDGEWLQDEAVRHGVLIPTTATEPCAPEGCNCAEYADFPITCYRLNPSLLDDAPDAISPTPPGDPRERPAPSVASSAAIAAAWDRTIPGSPHGIGARLFGLTNPWDSLYEREQARLTAFVHALLSGTGSTDTSPGDPREEKSERTPNPSPDRLPDV